MDNELDRIVEWAEDLCGVGHAAWDTIDPRLIASAILEAADNLTPQRTWVGLTEEDIRQCSRDVVAGGKENCVDRFAYAVEAKIKEKNA